MTGQIPVKGDPAFPETHSPNGIRQIGFYQNNRSAQV
jgi:hypothetical protein